MRALVTASFDPECIGRLERHMTVVHEDWKRDRKLYFDGEEFAARINAVEADVLIVEADLVHEEVFELCKLRMIGCCRGDPINVDRETASQLGVPIFFAPGRNAHAVADLTLAFMLCLARYLYPINEGLKHGVLRFDSTKDVLATYDKYAGCELGGATVGIIGIGFVGGQVARRLNGFGTRILAYDPYGTDVPNVERVDLTTLLRESDFVTVHCVADETTRNLIGVEELAAMKRGAYVLNLARATIVNEDALYNALTSGHIAGAALDVFSSEPVQPDNRFVQLPNVLVMPHLGGATVDVVRHQSEMIVESIEQYLAGNRPRYLWNPEVLGGGAAPPPAGSMSYVLTIDAGTAGGRAIIFDLDGRLVARAHETWGYEFSEGEVVPFVRECSFDPEAFWRALSRCVHRVLADGGVDPDAVSAVVTTSQREGCVFLDDSGREIYAGPNFDARGALEAMEAQQIVGAERLYEITGHAPPFIFPIARFLWFTKHRPAEKVRHIVMISDWIAYRLTGEVGMEPSNASESMLFDIKRREWSREILERLEIPAEVLPPLREPGEQIGTVTSAAAEATGIRRGTPVIVGGSDTHAALLGSGVIEPGETAAVIGSTVPVQMVLAEPLMDPAGSLWVGCHVVPGRWTLESNGGDSGGTYEWLLELLGATAAPDPYEAAEAWIRPPDPFQRPPHMFIGPSIFNLVNMNAYRPGGILFPFPLMDVKRPNRGDLVRGFFENVAFAVRGNCEQITSVTARPVTALHVSGGMSHSRRLVQIVADVMEDTLQVGDVAESAGLGCAVLGAVGLGAYPSIRDALSGMVRLTTVEPCRDGRYAEQYAKWRELYAALDDMNL